MSNRPGTDRQLLDKLAPYFHESATPCPYGLPGPAVYRVAAFPRIPEQIMETLLAAGYRRNGNNVYTMRCPKCGGCRPIRLAVRHFIPNRSQRRTLRKNQDVTIELGPLEPNAEKIALLDKFFKHRFPGRQNSAIDYYAGFFLNSSDFSIEIRYLRDDRLLGLGIADVGSSWLNAVYYFFDPDESRRSLGTFNIMQLINLCREHDLEHLYLGYTIPEIQSMRYKTAFLPHQILTNGTWRTIS
jgi:arginyl-tRNA--protein-N-Asp/Glu arginylyltransferase